MVTFLNQIQKPAKIAKVKLIREINRMKVHFRTLSGDTHTLDLDAYATIGDARKKINDLHIIISKSFKLVYDGETLADDKLISDLNLQDASTIIIHTSAIFSEDIISRENQGNKNDVNEVNEEEEEEEENGDEEEIVVEPDNFDNLVTELADLGYEKDACEAALRISKFNVEAAANLLIMENNPDIDNSNNNNGNSNNSKSKRKKSSSTSKKNNENFVDADGENNGEENNEKNMYVDDNDYSFSEEEEVINKRPTLGYLRETYEQFTSDERGFVDNMSKKTGTDLQTVIQLFVACDKNQENTESLLSQS